MDIFDYAKMEGLYACRVRNKTGEMVGFLCSSFRELVDKIEEVLMTGGSDIQLRGGE